MSNFELVPGTPGLTLDDVAHIIVPGVAVGGTATYSAPPVSTVSTWPAPSTPGNDSTGGPDVSSAVGTRLPRTPGAHGGRRGRANGILQRHTRSGPHAAGSGIPGNARRSIRVRTTFGGYRDELRQSRSRGPFRRRQAGGDRVTRRSSREDHRRRRPPNSPARVPRRPVPESGTRTPDGMVPG